MTNAPPYRRWPSRQARAALTWAWLLGSAGTACAQGYVMEFYQTYNAPMANFISNSALNNLSMIQAATPDAAKSGAANPSSTTPGAARQAAPASGVLRAPGPSQLQRNARELAQRFPADKREQVAQAYLQSFEVYQKLETKFGWSHDDVAGALAAFVVGNYMVMRSRDVADGDFVAVAEQLRRDPGIHTRFKGQAPDALRAMYEQSAMVGTFMALAQLSQRTTPQPPTQQAHLRDSARANLKQVLGADPERLQINAQGMQLR